MNDDLQQLHRAFADSGKLIEAGWISLRIVAIPPGAPQIQIDEMRNAFMAGAQHLWASINQFLDSGDEATAADERRMRLIQAELDAFAKELQKRLRKKGN